MIESKIESAHVERIENVGGRSMKFRTAERGWPDRLDLLPVPSEHRALVARYVRFTELKATKKKPQPHQDRRHRELRALGFTVDVVDER